MKRMESRLAKCLFVSGVLASAGAVAPAAATRAGAQPLPSSMAATLAQTFGPGRVPMERRKEASDAIGGRIAALPASPVHAVGRVAGLHDPDGGHPLSPDRRVPCAGARARAVRAARDRHVRHDGRVSQRRDLRDYDAAVAAVAAGRSGQRHLQQAKQRLRRVAAAIQGNAFPFDRFGDFQRFYNGVDWYEHASSTDYWIPPRRGGARGEGELTPGWRRRVAGLPPEPTSRNRLTFTRACRTRSGPCATLSALRRGSLPMSKKKQRPGLGLRQEGLAQGYGKRGWRKWWTARARRRLARHEHHLGDSTPMKLWTIQNMAAWEFLQREQVLVADRRYSIDCFREPYTWMVRQMRRRIRDNSETWPLWPLWAWYQWRGIDRRKPDLRYRDHLGDGDERSVRIEFEQPDSGALLSDFQLWNYVLNRCYLPETRAAGDAFRAELREHNIEPALRLPAAYHRRMADSWNRIFDLDWSPEGDKEPRDQKQIQATFWKLHLHQIRDVKFFTKR